MILIKKLSELKGHSGAIYSLEASETENCFYSGSSDKVIAKWNLDSFNPEKFAAQLPGIVYSLCLIAEKNILLAGTSEGKIHVIDLSKKKEIKTLQNHNHPVFDIKKSQSTIFCAGGDGILSIISIEGLHTIKLLQLTNTKLRSIDVYDNNAAIGCGDGTIRILDIKELKTTIEFPAHAESVYSVKFSPDGKYLLSGGKDAHLNIWEFTLDRWQKVKSIPAHNYAIYSIVFSPNGNYLATASRDKTIKIWNANTLEILARVNKENFDGHSNSVNKLFWSTHNKFLLSAGDDRKVIVWEVA